MPPTMEHYQPVTIDEAGGCLECLKFMRADMGRCRAHDLYECVCETPTPGTGLGDHGCTVCLLWIPEERR